MKNAVTLEETLVILPSLAMKIGFREAIILQQIHYWLTKSLHIIEGRKWVYNTYRDWQKQFPFWSQSTVKRTILNLEKQGLLISGNWNTLKLDKTKWYTIDYEKINKLGLTLFNPSSLEAKEYSARIHTDLVSTGTNITSSADLDEQSAVSKCFIERTVPVQAIPDTTSDTTTKKEIPIVEILDYLNHKTNSHYRPTTGKTKRLIQSRINEGFTLADFKKVIDLKTAEWLNDPYWSRYLRPETLFGTKFESYLNQKGIRKRLTEEDLNLDD